MYTLTVCMEMIDCGIFEEGEKINGILLIRNFYFWISVQSDICVSCTGGYSLYTSNGKCYWGLETPSASLVCISCISYVLLWIAILPPGKTWVTTAHWLEEMGSTVCLRAVSMVPSTVEELPKSMSVFICMACFCLAWCLCFTSHLFFIIVFFVWRSVIATGIKGQHDFSHVNILQTIVVYVYGRC